MYFNCCYRYFLNPVVGWQYLLITPLLVCWCLHDLDRLHTLNCPLGLVRNLKNSSISQYYTCLTSLCCHCGYFGYFWLVEHSEHFSPTYSCRPFWLFFLLMIQNWLFSEMDKKTVEKCVVVVSKQYTILKKTGSFTFSLHYIRCRNTAALPCSQMGPKVTSLNMRLVYSANEKQSLERGTLVEF